MERLPIAARRWAGGSEEIDFGTDELLPAGSPWTVAFLGRMSDTWNAIDSCPVSKWVDSGTNEFLIRTGNISGFGRMTVHTGGNVAVLDNFMTSPSKYTPHRLMGAAGDANGCYGGVGPQITTVAHLGSTSGDWRSGSGISAPFMVGCYGAGNSMPWQGDIAAVMVWKSKLSYREWRDASNGCPPQRIRATDLIFYATLDSAGLIVDVVRGRVGVSTGTGAAPLSGFIFDLSRQRRDVGLFAAAGTPSPPPWFPMSAGGNVPPGPNQMIPY